jgi:HPt (histidine-containing phosphotransfer) domain-containing protein
MAETGCMQAGMKDHVSKPMEVQKLFAVLRQWSPLGETSGGTTPPETMPDRAGDEQPSDAGAAKENTSDMQQSPPLPLIPGLNVEPAVKRLAGSVKLYMKTLKKVRDTLPDQGQKIADAYGAKDFEILRRELHTLKGLAATVGAEVLAETNARLEGLAAEQQLPDPAAMEDLQGQIRQLSDILATVSFD